MDKSYNTKDGYIFAPYIIINEPPVIIGDSSYTRIMEIKKRSEKIKKILNNINGI